MSGATVATVEGFVLPYREPVDNGAIRYGFLVKVTDSDGATGWGEAAPFFAEAARATLAVTNGLADMLRDRPAEVASCWELVRDHTWWYGVGGIASFASSALDMALWDLAGRRAGRPVLDLLGGAASDRLPVLVSCHAVRSSIEESTAEMAGWVAERAASGIKVGFGKRGQANLGYEHDRDVEFVAALRAALGPAPRLMIDVGVRNRWTVDDAIARVRAFTEHGLSWIEEPLGAEDPPGYARLRAQVDVPIAYGERAWTVADLARLLDTGTVDVLGIDPGRTEGVTGYRRGCELAERAGREVNAHAFSGPVLYAAALALSLASPACRQLEVPPGRNELFELADVPEPEHGQVRALPGPGLGLEVNEAAVRRRTERS